MNIKKHLRLIRDKLKLAKTIVTENDGKVRMQKGMKSPKITKKKNNLKRGLSSPDLVSQIQKKRTSYRNRQNS